MVDREGYQQVEVGSAIERPVPHQGNAKYGSDIVADTLRGLDIPYIALSPGASFRGLHDSLVNHLGNEKPQILLCLHEEHTVAIAQGWAKVTGKAMAVAVHANVGLFHATMAIFNAWCDRMPVLILGATGPVDAAKRRPWVDWIHTARDQGAIVRHYVKFDDQPASPIAAREAIARSKWIAETLPAGPVYVNLDSEMQEAALTQELPAFDLARYSRPVSYAADTQAVDEIAERLRSAQRPVILVGRVSRSEKGWAERIALAEAIGARVLTDLKLGAGFPTDHPLHLAAPGLFPVPEAKAAVNDADLVLSLDWVDLGGLIIGSRENTPYVVQVSLDHHLHNGWSMDHLAFAPVDRYIASDPDNFVSALCAAVGAKVAPAQAAGPRKSTALVAETKPNKLSTTDIAELLLQSVGDRKVSLLHLPLSWDGGFWPFRDPLDYIGFDGGGGIGGGPGIAVGAALALRGSGRLPVAICGDGDFLMGVTALWTAVHYKIPALFVIANNQSFYNDEVHQERMARLRSRPVENKWIGQKMNDPDIDMASLGRAQGATAFGPILNRNQLAEAYQQAIEAVERGEVAVIDVRIEPGYTPAMSGAIR